MKAQVNKKKLILETDCPYKNKTDWKEIPPNKVDTFKTDYGCEVQNCDDGQNYVKCGSCTRNTDYPQGCSSSNTNTSGSGSSGSNGNSGSSGSIIPTREDLKDAWEKFKEEAKKLENITPEYILSRGGNIVNHIYNMGKKGLKQVTGDLMSVIDSIPSPGTTKAKNVGNLSLEEVMSDGIELTQGNVGKNVTDLHKLLKKMGQTIDSTEYNQKLFGNSTEAALKNLQSKLEEPETGTLTSDFYNILIQNVESQRIESQKKKEEEEKNPYTTDRTFSIYENKELMTEEETQVSPEEQKEFLVECLNLGCFNSFIEKYKLDKTPKFEIFKNKNVYVLFKSEEKKYAFTYDFNIYSAPLDDSKYQSEYTKWRCGNKYCNTTQRLEYVQSLINNSPGTYEYTKTSDQSEKIDLSDETKKSANDQKIGNKTIFPKSGMCFIFRKSFEKGTEKDVIGQIETLLNKAGFSMNNPGVSDLQKISFPVGDILVLTPNQKEMFKEQLTRRAFPKQDSDFIKFIPKSTSLFKESCKNIFTKLYDGIQSPYDNFFKNQGQTQKYTSLMQYKIKAMMCEQTPKAMEFCLKNNDNRNICKLVRRTSNEYGIKDLIKSDSEQTNENFISKTIKEHLTRLSKQKKKSLLEKRIVENRFKILVENKNPKRIKDVNKFVQEAYDEMTYLSNQKYETNLISESLFDMMKLFVGPTGEQSVKKTFKQYVTNNLIQKLTPNKPNGYLAKIIEKTISELDLRDAPKLTDCHFVSEILTQSILNQIMIQKQKSEHHIENPLDELVADSIFDSLYESNIHERLSSGISNYICPRLNQIQSNLDNKFIQSKNRIF